MPDAFTLAKQAATKLKNINKRERTYIANGRARYEKERSDVLGSLPVEIQTLVSAAMKAEADQMANELAAEMGAAKLPTAPEPETVWGYSTEVAPERWRGKCASRAEAIQEGAAEFGDQPFYVTQGYVPRPSQFAPSADWIVEHMGEMAGAACGEAAEEWPDISTGEQEQLETLIDTWADQHIEVRFWIQDGDPELITPASDPPESEDEASAPTQPPEALSGIAPGLLAEPEQRGDVLEIDRSGTAGTAKKGMRR